MEATCVTAAAALPRRIDSTCCCSDPPSFCSICTYSCRMEARAIDQRARHQQDQRDAGDVAHLPPARRLRVAPHQQSGQVRQEHQRDADGARQDQREQRLLLEEQLERQPVDRHLRHRQQQQHDPVGPDQLAAQQTAAHRGPHRAVVALRLLQRPRLGAVAAGGRAQPVLQRRQGALPLLAAFAQLLADVLVAFPRQVVHLAAAGRSRPWSARCATQASRPWPGPAARPRNRGAGAAPAPGPCWRRGGRSRGRRGCRHPACRARRRPSGPLRRAGSCPSRQRPSLPAPARPIGSDRPRPVGTSVRASGTRPGRAGGSARRRTAPRSSVARLRTSRCQAGDTMALSSWMSWAAVYGLRSSA